MLHSSFILFALNNISRLLWPLAPVLEAHVGSSSDYNSFEQNRTNAIRAKSILKTADKQVLHGYQGKVTMNVMERTGGVKYILEKDLGE